jgi:prolyl-tRNA editing enzyme YbaK/EbsC (Cys-tRNA(Pro) deacylase)
VRCEGALTPDVASSAEALGVDVESIVKSLVFAVDGAFVVVVTNGETKVDVKKLASRMGVANRRVRLATREETIDACGFVPGTVPPFGHKENLRSWTRPCRWTSAPAPYSAAAATRTRRSASNRWTSC